MKFLKTNTATRVCVGPFLDATDGVTPETGLTVTNCTCEMMVEANDGSGVTRTALTLSASGGNNDMVHITSDVGGYYDLELTAANLNVLGRMTLSIIDTDVHCPVFHEYMILPAVVFDSLVAGTDTLQVDTTQWLGTACATPTVNGVPEVDVTHWIGTAAATPTTAGVPEVDVTHMGGAALSATSAQVGVNLVNIAGSPVATGSAQLGVNMVNIAGAAVSATTAQIGTNIVNIAGSAVNTATAQIGANVVSTAANAITATSLDATAGAEIADAVWDEAYSGHTGAGTFGLANAAVQGSNVIQWAGSAVATPTTGGVPEVDITHIGGAAVSTSSAQLGVNVVSATANSLTASALATDAVTEVVNGILAGVVDGTYTLKQVLQVIVAAVAGKSSGLDTGSPVYRDLGDTLNRIAATASAGNRSAVTITTDA